MKFLLLTLSAIVLAVNSQANTAQCTTLTKPPQCATAPAYTWTVNDFPAFDPTYGTHQNFSFLYQNPGVTEITTAADFNNLWVPSTTQVKMANTLRPVGFKYAIIKAYNSEIPCIDVTQAVGFSVNGQGVYSSFATPIQSYGVEILVYALDAVEICVKDLYGSDFDPRCPPLFDVCGQQRVEHCFIAPSDHTLSFSIYLKVQDSFDYDVPIFYRLRHSQYAFTDPSQPATGSTDMWCMMISGSVEASWPEFIAETPAGYKLSAQGSPANTLSSMFAVTFASMAALYALF